MSQLQLELFVMLTVKELLVTLFSVMKDPNAWESVAGGKSSKSKALNQVPETNTSGNSLGGFGFERFGFKYFNWAWSTWRLRKS
jgi:hypothetical protein